MKFSITPIEVWRDKRLTLEQIRVLGVLFSFRGKNTNTVWPSRQQIAERCGMHPSNISAATSALVRLGWLIKDGQGGYSKASRYTIVVPATLADTATVAEKATRMRIADTARGKEQTTEQTNRLNTPARKPSSTSLAKPKFDARRHLIETGVVE